MLTIRLSRTGRNKYPTYRVVAAESARAATGKFVAVLGHYNPHTKELVLKQDEVKKHLKNGAQPSNTVIKLLQREKVELPAWAILKTKQSKPKHEPEATPEPEPEAKAQAPADQPAAEVAAPAADQDNAQDAKSAPEAEEK